MIIIRLKGGMGNQMFQYAFGLNLAQRLGTELYLDLSSLLDRSKGDFVYRNYDLTIFNLEAQFLTSPTFLKNIYKVKSSWLSRVLRKQINKGKGYRKESHFHFEPKLVEEASEKTIYEGWFQSPKYFAGIESVLQQHFSFKQDILSGSQELFKRIKNTNSICLNVRRTDFIKVDNLNTTSKDYFIQAAKYFIENTEAPHFFIFSDDVEWCRENIKLNAPLEIVDHSHKGIKFSNYMQLMSFCKHFIIPNSSFAWWAVWLNNNPSKMVVAPKKWFNDASIDTTDLVPEQWIRLGKGY